MSIDLKLNACQEKQLVSYAVQKKVPGFRIKSAKKLGLIALLFAFLGVLTLSADTYASSWVFSSNYSDGSSRYNNTFRNPVTFDSTLYPSQVGWRASTEYWDSSNETSPNIYLDSDFCIAYNKVSGRIIRNYGYSYYLNPCQFSINTYADFYAFVPSAANGVPAGSSVDTFTYHDAVFTDQFLRAINDRDSDTFDAVYDFDISGGFITESLNLSDFTFIIGYQNNQAINGSCYNYYFDNPNSLIVGCSANLPSGVDFTDFHVIFGYNIVLNDLKPPIFNFTSVSPDTQIDFSGHYTISDGDNSFYGDTSLDVHAIQDTLGNQYSDGENFSFFGRLINAFRFSVINPFAPLFDMFSDADTCQPIPILATMLHVENPQSFVYCAWFPSSVRNILTPVVSGFATLIVFGFFVSWLKGSSNGVFSDDSRVIKGRGR